MRLSARGDVSARLRLRASIFDQPAWEKSIYFAVERLSREAGGPEIVADAIRVALAVDPMLAAEMIFRVTDETWQLIKNDIIAFADRWHSTGHVDRAIQFMVTTGRPDFKSYVWPLATNPNSQVQLPTLRSAERFRPAVLGLNIGSKVAALPEELRQRLLGQIAVESGVDGLDLATELAKKDPSPQVQAEVVQYLQFRRADRHVADLMSAAHDETWALVAKRGYADEISDPDISARLQQVRTKALTEAATPVERLRLLLEQSADFSGRDAAIAAAIADPAFPVRDQHAGSSIYHAQERAPAGVLQGLRKRLENGLELPFHAEDFLEQLDVTDDGPIAAAILDVSDDKGVRNPVAVMAGPKTVAALIDRYLASTKAARLDRANQPLWDEHRRLGGRLAETRAALLIAAVIERANTADVDHIHALAELLDRHGDDDARKRPLPLDESTRPRLLTALRAWTDTVVKSADSRRYDICEVASAIGRSGIPELLPDLKKLLDEDIARLNAAKASPPEARRRGEVDINGYGFQYRDAFARLGDESAGLVSQYLESPTFAIDAAHVLQVISNRQLKVPEPGIYRTWPWLDQVTAARAARNSSPKPAPANGLSEPIFAAIDRLAKPDNEQPKQYLAVALAQIALSMPHGDRDSLIDRVMALPLPLKAKCGLVAAITMSGRIVDATLIEQAIDEWLIEAEKNAWHSRQNTWDIEPWLELLPFSSRPAVIFDALAKVKAFYGTGWAKRWERVLRSVAAVPGPEGEALLRQLATSHKDIADDYDWMRAILGRNTPDAVLLYVDLYSAGVCGSGSHAADGWHVGRELAKYVVEFPELRSAMQAKYEAATDSRTSAMFEHLFGEIGSDTDLVTMVEKYAAAGKPFDHRMSAAVESVTVNRVPVREGSITYNVNPASVGSVRKILFGLLAGSAAEAALAAKCLTAIDRLRDQYGIADNDPRHPDITSGKPWPPEAAVSPIGSTKQPAPQQY